MAVAVRERSMGNDKARDLRYFFPSKYSERNSALHSFPSETNCGIAGSDTTSDEATRLESRRKRQRTTSPDRQSHAAEPVVAGVTCHELRSRAQNSSEDVVAGVTPTELKSAGTASSAIITHQIQKLRHCKPGYSNLPTSSRTPSDSEGAGIFGLGGKPSNSMYLKASRFPGAVEPIWPPKGMTHIRPHTDDTMPVHPPLQKAHISLGGRKLKYVKVQISAHDDILRRYMRLTQMEKEALENDLAADTLKIRRPRRMVMTGFDLQRAVWKNLVATLPPPTDPHGLRDDEVDDLSTPHCPPGATHSALLNMYKKIPDSLTAFDKFECETQDWVHKYAPKKSEDVLQSGREALILRDWLKSLTISSVESCIGDGPKAHEPSTTLGRTERRVKRKRRKRTEDLDDFLVSSEEEADQMDELVELEDAKRDIDCDILSKKTVVRSRNVSGSVAAHSQKAINAVVISGHHGCGKTAAIYAAAQELGFEVFEINAGSRRSGKDLLDKVGDMAQNHLVNHAQEKEGDQDRPEVFELPEPTKKLDLESGRQATVNSFFKPKPKPIPKSAPQAFKMPEEKVERQRLQNQKPPSQKQSLILLEEVDVLFEEDKHFWATTLELLISSKRPIVMTCTDESLLPLDEMLLFAILRFTAPPENLAVDYLLLVACNEGHFLSRAAVSALFKAKKFDLRASITELNFFCQMAIGDTKGGLEWMLIRSSSQELSNEAGLMLRVVSDGSYFDGMGCLSHEQEDQDEPNEGGRLCQNISDQRSVDCADSKRDRHGNPADQTSRRDAFQILKTLDLALDCVSVADTIPCSGFRGEDATILDTTLPEIEEKYRASYVDGSTLIEAEPLADHAGISTALALTLKICASRLMNAEGINASELVLPQQMLDGSHNIRNCKQNTRANLSATFDSIARPLKPPPTLPKGSYISSFDGPTSIVVKELGPYVRSIVSYDLKLEEHRRQLNMSLCQGRREGKMRTTRASRAALEGSHKQHIRRERWFPPETDLAMILQSGGQGWQDALWNSAQTQGFVDSGQDDIEKKSPSSSGSRMMFAHVLLK